MCRSIGRALTGRSYTGREIAALFDHPSDSNRPLRETFAKLSRDSLATLAGEVRKAIDSVDPTVRVCLCQSGCCDLDGDDTEAVARAFAGKTRPLVRVCGAAYMNENETAALPRKLAHVAWSVQHLPTDFEIIHETDSYPHTRFYNSTLFLGSELCAAMMAGTDGTYYYCTAYTDAPLEDDGYAAWMRENRPRLEAVRAVRATMRPCGGDDAVDDCVHRRGDSASCRLHGQGPPPLHAAGGVRGRDDVFRRLGAFEAV